MIWLGLALLVGATMLGTAGCTEAPGYLPPCVDPQVDPCNLDASADGDVDEGSVFDASRAATDARGADDDRKDR